MKGPFSGKAGVFGIGLETVGQGYDSLKLPEFQIILLVSAEAVLLALLLGLVLPFFYPLSFQ